MKINWNFLKSAGRARQFCFEKWRIHQHSSRSCRAQCIIRKRGEDRSKTEDSMEHYRHRHHFAYCFLFYSMALHRRHYAETTYSRTSKQWQQAYLYAYIHCACLKYSVGRRKLLLHIFFSCFVLCSMASMSFRYPLLYRFSTMEYILSWRDSVPGVSVDGIMDNWILIGTSFI